MPVPSASSAAVRRRDAVGIEGQAEVVVGAGENGAPAVDDALGRRDDALDLHAERIDAERRELAPRRRQALEFVEESHHAFTRRGFRSATRDPSRSSRPAGCSPESRCRTGPRSASSRFITCSESSSRSPSRSVSSPISTRPCVNDASSGAELGQDLRIFQHDIPGHAVSSFLLAVGPGEPVLEADGRPPAGGERQSRDYRTTSPDA